MGTIEVWAMVIVCLASGGAIGWITGFNAGWYRCFYDTQKAMPTIGEVYHGAD